MKRVWFIFASIYVAGIVVTGLFTASVCLTDHSLENMRWWFALILEGGFLLSPVVFVVACIIRGVEKFFSKTPAEEFSVSERSKRIFLIFGILFFLVIPFFLLRDAMFRSAAREGNIGRAKLWLALGADINSGEAQGGNTALTWAIIYGRQEMVEFLLKKNVQFEKNGILSLVPRGHEQIAEALKQYGAVETGKRSGQDALH
jgi:hypothetical protein